MDLKVGPQVQYARGLGRGEEKIEDDQVCSFRWQIIYPDDNDSLAFPAATVSSEGQGRQQKGKVCRNFGKLLTSLLTHATSDNTVSEYHTIKVRCRFC